MSELIGGWVAGLTATLIREGINKHRAREIAQGYWEAYCKDDLEAEIAQLRYDHETEVQRLTQERDAFIAMNERLTADLEALRCRIFVRR